MKWKKKTDLELKLKVKKNYLIKIITVIGVWMFENWDLTKEEETMLNIFPLN